MPTLEADALPSELRTKITNVRVRLRTLDLALAGERALLALVGAVVLSFVLDKWLEPELAVRRPFTMFVLASAVVVASTFVGLAFRRKLTDDSVAVLVEQVYPELEDGLVSSVQLARDLARGGLGHTSPQLIKSTISRTQQKARGLDFGRVVDASALLPLTFLVILTVGSLGLFVMNAATRPLAEAWFQRCVLGLEVNYPKAIEIKVIVPGETNGETAVARGDDVTAEILVTRGASKVKQLIVRTYPLRKDEGSGRIVRANRSREELRLVAGVKEGKGEETRFKKAYQNVVEPFEFDVDAGDHVVSSKHRVVVVDRPRIETAKFWLTYPEYVGLPATPENKPETQPDLRVPVGTRIRYQAVANKALAQADFNTLVDDPKAPRPTSKNDPTAGFVKDEKNVPVKGGEGALAGRVLTGEFVVKGTMKFYFGLVSKEGYDDGKKPVVYSVTAIVDRPPEVRILVPGRPKQVTPRALVPMEIDFKDEYGVWAAELRFKLDTTTAAAPGAAGMPQSIPLPGLEEGTKAQLIKYKLDLAEFGLHAGDKVTYWSVAKDRNIDTEKQFGASSEFLLQIVAPEDLARILQDRLQRVREELLATARVQKEAHDETENLVKGLAARAKLDDEDKRKLLMADTKQRNVTSRLVGVAQELDRLVEERELNRLADVQELDRGKDLRDKGKRLADELSPRVSQVIDDTRRAPVFDDLARAKIVAVPDLQTELESAILRLAADIEKYADFSDIIKDVRDLLGSQNRITTQTEEELKKNKGK